MSLIDAAKLALKQLEQWEVEVDAEWGKGRTLKELDEDGRLSEATLALRSAIKDHDEGCAL